MCQVWRLGPVLFDSGEVGQSRCRFRLRVRQSVAETACVILIKHETFVSG